MVEFEIKFGGAFKGLEMLSRLTDGVGKAFEVAQSKATKFIAQLQKPVDWGGMGTLSLKLDSFAQNMQRSADAIMGFMRPGIEFESKMAELSAGTGVTGKALNNMGQQARKLAVDLGLPAEQIADVYLQNLSKLSSELAKTAEGQKALADMAKTTALLSKGMGGDLAGATDALTTMMNAYNVDMSKPEEAARKMRMIGDMLTASFKEGAIDVGPLAASMKTLGASGYAANVSLAETLATMQVLGQKGAKVGAEGGTAMRNALAKLAQGELMPKQTLELLKAAEVNISQLTDKTKTFADRMQALKPIVKNDALMVEFFDEGNLVAGQAILQNLDAIREQTKKTQNASGALEGYSKVVTNTTKGVLQRLGSAFNDLAISAFDSLKPYVPMISLTSQIAVGVSAILPLFATMGNLLWAGAGGLLRYTLGLASVNGQLVFQKTSLLGVIVSMGRYIGTMLAQGIARLGLYAASQGAVTAGTWLFNAALSANPIGLVVVGIGVLLGALWALTEYFGGFGKMMKKLWEFVKEYNPFSLLAKAIDYVFGANLMANINSFFSWVEKKIMWLWNKIKGLGEILGFTATEVEKKEAEVKQKPLYSEKDLAKALPKGVDIKGIDKTKFTDIFGGGSETSKLPKLPGKDETKKGLEGVAGGGAKATNITINLQKLQDKIELHTVSVKEGTKEIEKQMIELMFRVLNATNQYQAN